MQRNLLLLLLLLFLSGCGGLEAASSGPGSSSESAPASPEVFLGRVLETDFQADFSVVHSWSTGYQGEIRLTYRGRQTLSGWNLGFDLPAEITSIWNAQVTTHLAQGYRVIGQAYNSDLSPRTGDFHRFCRQLQRRDRPAYVLSARRRYAGFRPITVERGCQGYL